MYGRIDPSDSRAKLKENGTPPSDVVLDFVESMVMGQPVGSLKLTHRNVSTWASFFEDDKLRQGSKTLTLCAMVIDPDTFPFQFARGDYQKITLASIMQDPTYTRNGLSGTETVRQIMLKAIQQDKSTWVPIANNPTLSDSNEIARNWLEMLSAVENNITQKQNPSPDAPAPHL